MARANSPLESVLSNLPEQPNAPVAEKLAAKASTAMMEAEQQTRALHQQLTTEETVPVTMAPLYRPYFGDIMTVGLNGLNIYLPVDGRTYRVPKSYAPIIQGRRRKVDDFITRRQRMSNVQSNFERYAGELNLIPR